MSAPMPSLYLKSSRPGGPRYWYLSATEQGKRRTMATGFKEKQRAEAEMFRSRYLSKRAVSPSGPVTLRTYAERWLQEREKQGMRSVDNARANLRLHVFPTLGDVRIDEITTRQVRELMHSMPGKLSRFGTPMAPRTVRHVYDVLKAVLLDAKVNEVISTTPWIILRNDLPPARDADPLWREGALYTRAECQALVSDERIPPDRRLLYALLWLTGARFGEVSALRWEDYDPDVKPLGRLSIVRSYSTSRGTVGPTKTGTIRQVPVHPVLASLLAQAPRTGALIVPFHDGTHRRSDRGNQLLKQDLEVLRGERPDDDPLFRPRRVHDLRRTFITQARSAGAPDSMVTWITHGPSQRILDGYTSTPWPALCEAVKLIKATLKTGTVVAMRRKA